MKVSARNQLIGKITQIKKGTVMCQVNLDLIGKGKMASVITAESAKDLKLKKGDQVRILVKAVNVLVAK
jgi:molybdate transport system regulatory protein